MHLLAPRLSVFRDTWPVADIGPVGEAELRQKYVSKHIKSVDGRVILFY